MPDPTVIDVDELQPDAGDGLGEIDRLMEKRHVDDRQSADRSARRLADRSEFSVAFAKVCQDQVRPAMEAVAARLRQNGGGGLIEERPANLRLDQDHRLTLWMSLSGEVADPARPDRNPYLQLDADTSRRVVAVSEGDMWEGSGGNRSGKVADWQLGDLSGPRVTGELLPILRRAFQ
jgi:hypothetical protein